MIISNAVNLGWLLAASLAFTNLISALPSEPGVTELVRRAVDPKDPLTWDTNYIKEHIITKTPAIDSCIFYSSGLSDVARDWSAAHKGTTVYDVYDCDAVFSESKFPFKNFIDKNKKRAWFQITSRAFTETCSGTVYLVIKSGTAVPPTAIWNTDEYDAIKKGNTKVTKVIILDPTLKTPLQGDYDPTPGAPQVPKDPVQFKKEDPKKLRREILEEPTPTLAERAPPVVTATVIPLKYPAIPIRTEKDITNLLLTPNRPDNCPIIE
ncbi:MAG: hypothetical protein M1814_005822 [Vezdaea aestivalis]|nr:MAG: hypothetical protein M1814_005822 [Vezdaea aestivalis]